VNGDVVEMREVELGLSQNGSVELVSGVVAGEEVVVAGQNELRDGDKVEKKA
jgi:multidrug efflux pump subunit AcrA (membrane-fusion protein)